MLLFFIAIFSTGMLLKYGTRGNGLDYYWQNVHVFLSGILSVLVLFYLLMQFKWFKKIFVK